MTPRAPEPHFYTVYSNTTDRSLNTKIGSSCSNSTMRFIRQKDKVHRKINKTNRLRHRLKVHGLQKCILLLVVDLVLKRISVPKPDDMADFANFGVTFC